MSTTALMSAATHNTQDGTACRLNRLEFCGDSIKPRSFTVDFTFLQT